MTNRILTALLWPLAALGAWASRVRHDLDVAWRIKKNNLAPGTEVRLTCRCDFCIYLGSGPWYIDYYSVDGDDYHLVREWPRVSRGIKSHAYIPRKDLELA